MIFDKTFFHPFRYSSQQLSKYFINAKRDLHIALQYDDESSIAYRFCYDSIIKLGIALIAEKGYRIRSIPGHHIKILDQLGKILDLSDEIEYFERIRRKRNVDLYEGGTIFSETEASELLKITQSIFNYALKKSNFFVKIK